MSFSPISRSQLRGRQRDEETDRILLQLCDCISMLQKKLLPDQEGGRFSSVLCRSLSDIRIRQQRDAKYYSPKPLIRVVKNGKQSDPCPYYDCEVRVGCLWLWVMLPVRSGLRKGQFILSLSLGLGSWNWDGIHGSYLTLFRLHRYPYKIYETGRGHYEQMSNLCLTVLNRGILR